MSVTVQDLDNEIKTRVERYLTEILTSLGLSELTLSPICAHVIQEGARLLNEKKAEQSVLSSSIIFVTAMLFGIGLASEGLPVPEADDGDELIRLQSWGLALRSNYGPAVEMLVDSLFATEPVPARNLFEHLEQEPLSEIRIGPGLARALTVEAGLGPITTPGLLVRVVRDDGSGIAQRLRESGLEVLAEPLLEKDGEAQDAPGAPRGPKAHPSGRHARMFREAEEDELVLGARDYAKAIATVLRAAKGEFTFALFGRWGSGKTTLISQLKPLLQDASYYREAIGVSHETKELYARRSYRVVVHNAWKYRSRPEAWVYAYKSLADEAARGFWPMGRLLLAIRTSVYRRGIWPIVGGLIMLALVALPLTAKLQLAVLGLSVAGFSTLVYFGAVTTSVSGKVRALFAKHLRLTQVDGRLGMLALIGDDVRALLAGWTARVSGDDEDRCEHEFPPGRLVLPLLAIATIAALWAAGLIRSAMLVPKDSNSEVLTLLIPTEWTQAIGPLQNIKPGPPSMGEWIVFGLWSLLALVMLALPWLWRWGCPNRVLMVIDDLDRCSASEMLDVIEGMKLLVDDSTVNRRLQVLMLVDESVLDHAIASRYATMIEERVSDLEGDARKLARARARENVITEQNEKLFACYLRIAPLSASDVEEVVTSLAGREQRQRDLVAAQDLVRQARATAKSAEGRYQRIRRGFWRLEDVPARWIDKSRWGDLRGQLPNPISRVMIAAIQNSPADIRRAIVVTARSLSRTQETPEERLRIHPEVVREREEAAKAVEAAEAQLRAVDPHVDQHPLSIEPLFEDADVRFNTAEVQELRDLVPSFLEELQRQPSPRLIRVLLFKIQLCRLLLQLRYPYEHDERTVGAILDAFSAASKPSRSADPEGVAIRIARQVI